MVYFCFKTADGITLKMPVQEVAKKLGIKLDSLGTVGLISRKDGNSLIATAEDKDETYPGITLKQNIGGAPGTLSVTELPNEDNEVRAFLCLHRYEYLQSPNQKIGSKKRRRIIMIELLKTL